MHKIDIVLTENYPILSLTLLSEPLRIVNRECGEPVWQWRLLSVQGGEVPSSSGISLDTHPLDEEPTDVVVLLSAYHPEKALVPPLLTWLKRKARTGSIMGCVDTGALIFAEAGLLRFTPAAVHFEALRAYQEKFRDEMFVDRLFNVTENRCSSAGGVATLDMTLGLIEHFDGEKMALRVAEILNYRPTRFEGPQQKLLAETASFRLHRDLGRAVELMIATLDQPLSISEIAVRTGISHGKMARLFNRYVQQTPSAYYRYLRLNQARNLLRNSGFRIAEVAALCGFENIESFSRAYRRLFDTSATMDRN